ncbi:chemotaxis protein CheV [Acidithiobacillus thiooxidans]|uniref:chemotaxis protein n=1 Tax=Acidithiobacillus thiooxidans TaxID=930 RepID=UPI001C07A2D1|nr:chemotaxis protein [Acidithiobacillus thiooxidans]MBU2793121.1 chemotaxis protein CheV [Acidithiobacillus thiooxidans]
MSSMLQEVNERSQLAGTNRFELLLFQLGKNAKAGTQEIYGINVFKVREALVMPSITPMPGAPEYVMGVANIRGQIIPVVNLPAIVGCEPADLNILLVTEYERSIQGFAVEDVEEIRRLEWGQVISAEAAAAGSLVTSLARLDEDDEKGRLALVLDVEQILRLALPARFKGGDEVTQAHDVQIPQGAVILYADDSGVARSQIEKALTHLGLPFIGTKTGKEAWERLQIMAKEAKAAGIPIRNKVAMVLTDLEMPEMDGFTLTRHLKEHDVLKDVPVVIHSSLSGTANESHANSVGANGYVAKFVPDELARAIAKVL